MVNEKIVHVLDDLQGSINILLDVLSQRQVTAWVQTDLSPCHVSSVILLILVDKVMLSSGTSSSTFYTIMVE